jgi:chromate transporter
MQLLLLYWVLLQSMLTSFTGLSSLPVIRHELVETRHWIDDRELNAAVMIGRSTPGPMGVYVVCVGYFVAGYPGAAVGALAMATPALLILLLIRFLKDDPRLNNAIRYVVLAGSAYSLAALAAMSPTALTSWWTWAIGFLAAILLLRTRLATGWIVLGAGLVGVMLK